MNRRVSELLVDHLVKLGYDTFFLVTGGAIAPTVDYIGTKTDCKYYCFHHEQSAAMAAEAFYRTTGQVGVVLATSGPGAQNLMNGLCGCWFESIPCLFITGQVSTYESVSSIEANPRQLGFQESNVVDMVAPFTKFVAQITDKDQIEDCCRAALALMEEGRKGPCLIDLPVNIQTSTLNKEHLEDKDRSWPMIIDNDLNNKMPALKKMIEQSKRPLILLGNGVRLSQSASLAKEFVESTGIPFVVSWGGFDLLPHDHPQFIGDIGVYGKRGANFAVQNCDLLISLGSRLDTRQTGGNLKLFSRKSLKVMVDIDKNEVFKGRGLEIDLPIVNDLHDFFVKFQPTLKKVNFTLDNKWLEAVNKWRSIEFDKIESNSDNLSSYMFLKKLNAHLPDNAVIIPDQGGNLVWSMQSIKIKDTQRMFSNFGNSSMGWALPASIGAAVGTSRPVVCIDGDGGFQMNIQELQTIKTYNLPIKIIILNNRSYGIIKQFQEAYFDSRYTATQGDDYKAPSFARVAEAYDIKAFTIDTEGEVNDILQKAFAYEGPALIEVIIDKQQKLTPKLEFGNPLEDMSPYLTDQEIEDNMLIETIERRDNTQGWVSLEDE